MLKRLKEPKKLIIAIAVVFLFLIIPAASLAQDAIGSRIEIEKIDGTAYVVKKGKKIDAKKGVKLSASESIQTAAASYVYISLDDTKVIKIDELSRVNIEKKGKKLKIVVEEGSIFFNVTEKLAEDESMSIEASTMAMSIRGTAGIVSLRRINDEVNSTLTLLDGQVNVTYSDMSGADAEFILWGGEQVIHNESSKETIRDLIDVTELPGFVAVEIAGDDSLAEKMRLNSGLNPKWPSEHSDEMLEESQEYNLEHYGDVFEDGSKNAVKRTDTNTGKKKTTPIPTVTVVAQPTPTTAATPPNANYNDEEEEPEGAIEEPTPEPPSGPTKKPSKPEEPDEPDTTEENPTEPSTEDPKYPTETPPSTELPTEEHTEPGGTPIVRY